MKGKAVPRQSSERGVALIAVLWIVAALAILVTGISYSVRSELRQVSASRESVQAKGLAQAGIFLALQNIFASAQAIQRQSHFDVVYSGTAIDIRVVPMNGLIDLNLAPKTLLIKMLEIAAAVDKGRAESMAQTIMEAREIKDKKGHSLKFDAIEDILQLPGFDYDLYVRLQTMIAVDTGGSGKVNVLAAPPGVLNILSGGSQSTVDAFLAARDSDAVGLDTSAFDGSLIDSRPAKRFKVEARISLPSASSFRLTCSAELSSKSDDGIPWRVVSCSHQLETAAAKKA